MNEILACPICSGKTQSHFLSAIDYTVSQNLFNIVACGSCGFKFTSPIPAEDKIGDYYKSESYVSHSSTNKGLVNKLYQLVRKRTLKQKVKLVGSIGAGKKVLDIGSGTGHFLNELTKNQFNAVGLEPDDDARHFAKTNFKVDIHPLENLYNQPKNNFDVITMWHVLEHVYHLQKDVKQMVGLLKDDGKLVIAVPNCNSHDAKHYKTFWAAYDLPIHLYHFTPNDISNLAEQHDLKVDDILPMKFDSYYVSMLSEKYKKGSIFSAFYRGLISNLKAKKGTYSSQIYILSKKQS